MRRLPPTFLLFPLSQLATAVVSLVWIVQLGMPQGYLWLVFGLMVASVPADLLLFREMKNAQDADMARVRLALLEEQVDIQTQYREQMEQERRDIQALRRRVALELERAAELLEAEEAQAAEEGVQGAIDLMGSSSYRLCAHRSVDAAATMKARLCEEAGVEAQFALDVPEDVPLPAVELCAIVVNLADNGIAAAKRAKQAGIEKPEFALKARMRGDYLVFEAVNSVTEEEGNAWVRNGGSRSRFSKAKRSVLDRQHGWGLSIIRGIAERHEGSVMTEIVDGAFHTSVVLKTEASEAQAPRVCAAAEQSVLPEFEDVLTGELAL